MLVRAVPALLLVVTACRASEAPTPASPPSAATKPEAAAPEVTTPAADHALPTDAILEAILTDDRFAMYLHPDAAGRVPVVVSGKARPEVVSFELHGEAVVTRPLDSLDPGQAFVDIGTWSVEGDRARVALGYAIEGIGASFTLERDASGTWIVTEADVAEH